MLNEIHPGIFWFHPPAGSEVYLVRTREGLVLIDAGFEQSAPALAEALRAGGFDPADVRLAIATHQHGDHIAGLAWWHREHGVPVLAHADDADAIVTGDPLRILQKESESDEGAVIQ
jgi:metallo-beta-lactamase class B